ncbi:MAG TPA: hypothetical protein VG488_11270 [Candidatus Angelobacter sp.]|nr:hypothetical protein [Candidatus Angelobacter sp.]
MMPSSTFEHPRRSSRVLVTLPLAVSGQRGDGSHISGAAETILVNKHGAKIRSAVVLEPSMEVRVAMLAPYKWRLAQVVWADEQQNEYGIQLDRPENFWGVYFPPEDWELRIPGITAHDSGATSPQAEAAPVQKKPEAPSVEIPEGGTIVTLRGVAASQIPFQEQGLLVPVSEHDATLLIEPFVELGAKVWVIINKKTVPDAVVLAIARSREYDRWRVWLRFSQAIVKTDLR